jgi:hypothetical protein
MNLLLWESISEIVLFQENDTFVVLGDKKSVDNFMDVE